MAELPAKVKVLNDLSVAGLQQIGGHVGNTKRTAVGWLFIFLFAVGMMSVQIWQSSDLYLSYPTNVNPMFVSGTQPFPSVSFCSPTVLKKSVAMKIPVFQELAKLQDTTKNVVKRQASINDQSLTVAAQNTTSDTFTSDAITAANESEKFSSVEVVKIEVIEDHVETHSRIKRSVAPKCNYSCNGTALPPIKVYNGNFAAAIDCGTQCRLFSDCLSYSFNDPKLSNPPSTNPTVCACWNVDCCTQPLEMQYHPKWPDNDATTVFATCSNIFDTSGTVGFGFSVFVDGNSYTFICKPGYTTTSGSTSQTYNCNGQTWDILFKKCYPTCTNIFDTSGTVSPTTFIAQNFYTFVCRPNYATTSGLTSQTYKCIGANWNIPFQQCYPPCPATQFDSTGTITNGPYINSHNYIFNCLPTYVLVPSLAVSSSYKCVDGAWGKPFEKCYATCPTQFDSTGTIKNGPYIDGNIYDFTCVANFLTQSGATTQTYKCGTGNWDKTFQKCHATCPYQFDSTGTIKKGPYIDPNVYNFICAANFLTDLGATLQTYKCDLGKWDKVFQPCHAECFKYDQNLMIYQQLITYSNITSNNMAVSSTTATFSCQNNFTLYGKNKTSTCANGEWTIGTIDIPICLEQNVASYTKEQLATAAGLTDHSNSMSIASSSLDLIPYIWANLSSSMRSSLSLSRNDIVLGCMFNDRLCKTEEIYETSDLTSGNCYTFNHKYLTDRLQTGRAGRNWGLSWIFNTNQDEFFIATVFASIKLIIQEPFDPLFTDYKGVAISPGFVYDIAITKVTELKVQTPVKNCVTSTSQVPYYFLNDSSYLNEGCLRSFQQQKVIDKCNCSAPTLPNTHVTNNSPFCRLEQRQCVQQTSNSSSNGVGTVGNDGCDTPCQETIYRLVVTAAIEIGEISTNGTKHGRNYIKNNIIKVNIFYLSLDAIVYVESESYPLLQLISDVGSVMGLWIGVSMISLVELLVVIVRMFVC